METFKKARNKIFAEIASDDADARAKFLEKFKVAAEEFSGAMAKAVLAWRELDATVGGNEKLAYVSALVFTHRPPLLRKPFGHTRITRFRLTWRRTQSTEGRANKAEV